MNKQEVLMTEVEIRLKCVAIARTLKEAKMIYDFVTGRKIDDDEYDDYYDD